jgi:hypothetical protein
MGSAFGAALILAAVVIAILGAGERGTGAALGATAAEAAALRTLLTAVGQGRPCLIG